MEIKDSLLNLSVTWQVFILGILGLVSNFAFAPYYQIWILLISFSMFSIFLFYSKGFKQSFLFLFPLLFLVFPVLWFWFFGFFSFLVPSLKKNQPPNFLLFL